MTALLLVFLGWIAFLLVFIHANCRETALIFVLRSMGLIAVVLVAIYCVCAGLGILINGYTIQVLHK